MSQRRVTLPTLNVLSVLYADLDGPHYGFELSRKTQLASGTLYPILARLEVQGLVSSEWETIDPVKEGRPARRYYKLTAQGIRVTEQERVRVTQRLGLALGAPHA